MTTTANNPFTISLPATRLMQGSNHFFNISCPNRVFTSFFKMDDATDVMGRSQRITNENRAIQIADYIDANRENFIIPSLVGSFDSHNPDDIVFTPASEQMPDVGMLTLPLDVVAKLFDGQHRGRGVGIMQQRDPAFSFSVPLMMGVNLPLEVKQQFFSDLNSKSAKVSASLNIAYNKRCPVSAISVAIVESCVAFQELTDFEKNVVSANSGYLYTLQGIQAATKTLLGFGAKVKPEQLEGAQDLAIAYWNAVTKALSIDGLRFDGKTAEQTRERHIKTHQIFIRALGLAGKHLIAQFGDVEKIDFSGLASLNYNRHGESDFVNRCVKLSDNTMIVSRESLILTANKILMACKCPLTPEMAQVERQMFGEYEETTVTEVVEEVLDQQPEASEISIPAFDAECRKTDIVNVAILFDKIEEKQVTKAVVNLEKVFAEYREEELSKQDEFKLQNFSEWLHKGAHDEELSASKTLLNVRSLRSAIKKMLAE